MSYDPLEVLASLGPLEEYRQAGKINIYMKNIQKMMAALQNESRSLPSERQQVVYMLDIFEKMLITARHRACDCEAQRSLACENVDVFHIMAEWIDFNRKLFKGIKT